MHRAHDITERVKPEQVIELWNMTNAILRRVPWEYISNVSSFKTKELVDSVDQVIRDVQALPLNHVLNVVDMFVKK